MHPISVYMLSRLSDYLQNRSSMNLISQYITSVSDVDISKEMPYVLPTELMSGDLFSEMLSAETSGRHRSDNCIRFENILKKNGQKFNEKHISVLRANLISRALRFNTRNYAEAKYSLMLCSGLSETELDEALTYLVDEYAVLAFDEMAGCFDFTEDAKGAYSYKILKQRLLAKQDINLRSLFKTATILDLGGFIQNQQTNFGTNHKILTNEWCFTQELMLEEDMDDNVAISYVKQWKEAKSVVVPKGKLIWIYVNKDTDYHATDRLKKIAAHFNGTAVLKGRNNPHIDLDVDYCMQCHRFFININEYNLYRKKYLYLLGPISFDKTSSQRITTQDSFSGESPLMLRGYNVNAQKGLTEKERHLIISDILDQGDMTKTEIKEYLNRFIDFNGSKEGNESARKKWKCDLRFTQEHRKNEQPKVTIKNIKKH